MARLPGHEPVYELADIFRQRCLTEGRSLLWPNDHVWTNDNLQRFWDAFVGNPDTSSKSFFEKFQQQLADEPQAIYQIAADIMLLYSLFPRPTSIGVSKKVHYLEQIRGWSTLIDPDPDTWAKTLEAFKLGVASTGTFYSAGQFNLVAFYLKFCQLFVEQGSPVNFAAALAVADRARDLVKDDPLINKDVSYGRNAILHLLFPDEVESIASSGHRKMIIAAFAERCGVSPDSDQDEALLRIRRHFQQEQGPGHFNFYDPEIRKLWDPPKGAPPVESSQVTGNETEVSGSSGESELSSDIATLVSITYLPEPFLDEIHDLMLVKQQLILDGPPGSGKTFVATKFAEWFAGDAQRVQTVQFHQSYGYEDFVQGIRPETSASGSLTYRVRDGIFKRFCEIAAADRDHRYVFIIDEINRGNISRILGELLLLLEYRDRTITLPYGEGQDGRRATLTIPSNLYIIGTMNSADRSLSQIDYALRRRFYFMRFMPVEHDQAAVLDRWLRQHAPSVRVQILQRFISLNQKIEQKLSPDFQIGHSYFMQDWIGEPGGIERVWKYAVRPLLDEYFHHHRDHAAILQEFSELFDAFPDMASGNDGAALDEMAVE